MFMKKTKRIIYIALLSALAIALHTFEASLALPLPYGIKLGLANIISLITIEVFDVKEMVIVNLMRVFLGGLLSGNIFNYMWFISLGGVVLSSLAIVLAKKLFNLPIISLSIVSALFHGIGQIIVVSFIYDTYAFIPVLLIMMASSIPTGLFTGACAGTVIKYLQKHLNY